MTLEALCVAFIEQLERHGHKVSPDTFTALAAAAASAGYDVTARQRGARDTVVNFGRAR